jgi:hypothetical protein
VHDSIRELHREVARPASRSLLRWARVRSTGRLDFDLVRVEEAQALIAICSA